MRPFHLLSSLSLLLLLLLFINADGLKLIETNISNCPVYDCGNGVKITYPFWVSDPTIESSSYCGYEDFMVTCNGSSPSFRTYSDSYTVKEIDTTTHTLSLIDTDVIGASCPRVRHSVNISAIRELDFAHSVVYLYFFFNCSLPVGVTFPDVYHATCLKDQAGDSYVFRGPPNSQNDTFLSSFCSGNITSPVMPGQLNEASLANTFGNATNGGFDLTWRNSTMENCIDCEKSGGHCGYTNQSGDGLVFQCYCRDGVYNGDCYGSKNQLSDKTRIGIALGGVFFGLILAGVGFFMYWRHNNKKGRTSSLSSLMRSITPSSYPSSFDKDPESLGGEGYYKTPIFSFKELTEATGNFDPSNELGDGGFGVVYKGKLKDGRIVAVKRLYERNFRRVKQFRNEVEILNRLRHRNLVILYGCTSSHESQDLVLVYEYIPNGTLADHLHGSRAAEQALTWPRRMAIAIETADALAYLHVHQPQIIHRDVKTSNILLDSSFTVKVADFGLSRLFPLDVTHVSTAPQGTPGYVDPEYHQCYQLTDKSDVYSFGVVLVELISSKPAVDISRHRSQINLSNMAIDKIPKGQVQELVDPALGFDNDPVVRKMVEQVAEVAFRCLQPERDMRPSMEEVREMLKDIAGVGRNTTANGGRPVVGRKDMSDGASLLRSSSPPFSPKSVADRWISSSSSPFASA